MLLGPSSDPSEALSLYHGVGTAARYIPCYYSNSTAEVRLPFFWILLNSQEERNDDTALPLGVKLTVYRLLNMTTIISFCFAKGFLTYKGLSTVPTTLDWVSGGLLAAVWVYLVHFTKSIYWYGVSSLYWIGLYEEGRHSKKWEWFFQDDLAPAIGYCAKRAVGGCK